MVILDDEGEPVLEGEETFSVSLTTADLSSVIGDKSTTLVTIDDSDLDGMHSLFSKSVLYKCVLLWL